MIGQRLAGGRPGCQDNVPPGQRSLYSFRLVGVQRFYPLMLDRGYQTWVSPCRPSAVRGGRAGNRSHAVTQRIKSGLARRRERRERTGSIATEADQRTGYRTSLFAA